MGSYFVIRISYFVSHFGKLSVNSFREAFFGRLENSRSIIRANMRVWLKKVVFLTGLTGLSCY